MNQDSIRPQRPVGTDGRNGLGTGAELDRLVEDELAALVAEMRPPEEPAETPVEPAQRFLEDAATFLASRPDRAELLSRLQAMVLDSDPTVAAPKDPDPEPE
jgi:hypothetical protein